MPHIQVRGVDHYYEWITAARKPEPCGKPVMVFLHGWGGSARYWESTAWAIADTFDCLLYDMRGFGRSAGRTPSPALVAADQPLSYKLDSYATDLAELLNKLGLKRVYLNAHSMGASIAVYFLNLYPELVERAILTCNGIFEYDERAFSAFHKFGGYVVKFRPNWLYKLPYMDRMFMKRFLHRSLPGAISRAFLDDFLMADYDAALETIFACVSKQAAELMPQEFAKITVPTLLVAGDRDIIIPAELGRRAAALNHQIEFVVIPDTAHFPMLEDIPTYLNLIRTFLKVEQTQQSVMG